MSLRLKILLYPLFTVLSLVFFILLLFPFESVKNRLSRELEHRLGDEYAISISRFSPALLTGVVLKDIEIRHREDPKATPVKLSRAKLNFSILSFLTGGMEVSFDVRAGEGKATGWFASKKSGLNLDLQMDRFDLSLAGLLIRERGVFLTGSVNGAVRLELFPQDPLRNNGKITLEVPDLRLSEMRLWGGIQLPALRLAQQGNQKSKLDIAIERGNLEVKEVQLAGGDLTLQAKGKVYGARQFHNYRFNLKGSFKVADEMAKKLPLTPLEKQKTSEGVYPFTITGRISRPDMRIGDIKVPI